MLSYINGNLLDSPAKVLVNPVNTVGVMGKGLAKEFKRLYPDMFEEYRDLCAANKFSVGQLWLYKTPEKWILNFPTKSHWRSKSRLEDIKLGLQKFVKIFDQENITSIAFPQLGCGSGDLDWESQVKPLMTRYLTPLNIEISVYIYTVPHTGESVQK